MCDCEPADVYAERFPVARKEHRCAECWSVIQPGEQYLYATYCYDGRWSDYKRCASCSMWARLVDCFCFGQLQDALIERFLRGQRPSQFWMEPGEKIKHWWGDPVTPEEVVNWTC